MASDEFSIIARYFSDIGTDTYPIALGIGDDAAVVDIAADRQLVLSMDTLIAGVHFPDQTEADDIAHKALAVNLSDLAAMAADPAWFLLSITLPQVDEQWLRQFSAGLREAAARYDLPLIGGDTCRGQLALTIQIAGTVPTGRFVTRAGAQSGDLILVSGELGNAGLGLARLRGELDLPRAFQDKCDLALKRPRPRLELRPFLRRYANAAIDISDGLQGDLGHILGASSRGARIDSAALPVDAWIASRDAWDFALAAGDDYEICCCVAPKHQAEIETWNREHPDCRLSCIGEITESGYTLKRGDELIDLARATGYRHFD